MQLDQIHPETKAIVQMAQIRAETKETVPVATLSRQAHPNVRIQPQTRENIQIPIAACSRQFQKTAKSRQADIRSALLPHCWHI